jgi:hypothetical protein
MTALWDTAPRSLVEVGRRFRGAYYLHSQINALMMEAVRTSETSVNFCETTQRNNSEGYHIHTRRRENLKSHCYSLSKAFIIGAQYQTTFQTHKLIFCIHMRMNMQTQFLRYSYIQSITAK